MVEALVTVATWFQLSSQFPIDHHKVIHRPAEEAVISTIHCALLRPVMQLWYIFYFYFKNTFTNSGASGRMLAPNPLSQVLPMLTSQFQQECIRGTVLRTWGLAYGDKVLSMERYNTWRYISGINTDLTFTAFRSLIDRGQTQNVLLYSHDLEGIHFPTASGYNASTSIDAYTLYVKH